MVLGSESRVWVSVSLGFWVQSRVLGSESRILGSESRVLGSESRVLGSESRELGSESKGLASNNPYWPFWICKKG